MSSNNDSFTKSGLFVNGYALVIGIANYSKLKNLPKTVIKDAQDFSNQLRNPQQCGYPEEQVKCLTDDRVTANDVRKGLEWLAKVAQKDATAVFFFSGHGGRIADDYRTDSYLITYDTDPYNIDETAINGEELTKLLQHVKASRLLVIFDCCHSGGLGQAKNYGVSSAPNLKTGLDDGLIDRLGQGNGRVIIASSRSDEYSWILSEMENSLFTYYLLKAMQGDAPVRGDGLIRLFDLFDYVSQKVTERHSDQHPILKAELENNFPIALYLGGKGASSMGKDRSHQTTIQNFLNFSLNPTEEEVLLKMFEGYERLVLKSEFGGGFSGSRVLMLRPLTSRGAELPSVVKLGGARIIQQEWAAFNQFIRQKVPNVAQVEGTPVYSNKGDVGGIRYPLVGDGRFHIESLGQFCQHAAAEDVVYVLEKRLFPSISAVWQDHQVVPELFWGNIFDPILPINLIVRVSASLRPTIELTPQNIRHQAVQTRDAVSLSNFIVTNVDEEAGELTLNLPISADKLQDRYRLRVTGVTETSQFQEGRHLSNSIVGEVQSTRYTLLKDQIEQSFKASIDGTADTLSLPGVGPLSNPLKLLSNILNQTNDLRVGSIHGDLNLENILVEYDQRTRNVHLIDFASARYDCVLHDLLRIETSFWLYLVPLEMVRNGCSLANLGNFVSALHSNKGNNISGLDKPFHILTAVRQMAQHLLAKPYSWDEYYQGLIVYLLGALKFSNLDDLPMSPLPKQVAIVTASLISQFGKDSSMPTNPSSPSPPLPKSDLLRTIRFHLRKMDDFESDEKLRAIFLQNSELKPWVDRIPESNARKARADMTVAFLLDKYNAENQNALVVFLQVLARESDEDENLYSELANFANQLQQIL